MSYLYSKYSVRAAVYNYVVNGDVDCMGREEHGMWPFKNFYYYTTYKVLFQFVKNSYCYFTRGFKKSSKFILPIPMDKRFEDIRKFLDSTKKLSNLRLYLYIYHAALGAISSVLCMWTCGLPAILLALIASLMRSQKSREITLMKALNHSAFIIGAIGLFSAILCESAFSCDNFRKYKF